MRRVTVVSALLAVFFCAVAARAEHTRFWEQSNYDEFDKGTHKGVALRSDGILMPAPEFQSFADPNLAYVWSLVVDSHGRLYAAGGSDAKVLRVDRSGKTTQVFESSELEAQTLAVDAHDNVYVGTSPDGKVYKITPQGQHSVFFDPKAKYIWALAFDSRGYLFVGTGDKGQVFVVAPDGKGQLFYKSDESHARALAFDKSGDLLIGTDPNGLIIRVPMRSASAAGLPQAGKPFVVYETSKKEVTALATDAAGSIYAAAVGNKAGAKPTLIMPAINEQARLAAALRSAAHPQGQMTLALTQAQRTATPMIYPFFTNPTGGSQVYRIAPDGSPQSLWSSPEDIVYSLGFSPQHHLLLGTGNHGEVIELDGDQIFSSIASADASQVTSLAPGPAHTIYVATANPGKLFTLGPAFATKGTFESDTFDADIFSHWGRISWWGENGATDGKIEFYVRSGNTSDPDGYWSPWTGPYTDSSGSKVQCPPARFLQWKAVFHTSLGSPLPELSWVKLAYLRKNVAPVIEGIVVERPGLRAQGFGSGGQTVSNAPVALRVPRNPVPGLPHAPNLTESRHREVKFTPPPQGYVAKGFQTAVWTAQDDNDDHLTYTLYYRGEKEKDWKLLKKGIRRTYYSWDTNSMPDGPYVLKLLASDALSNPPDQALTAERVSDRFIVDNTPPTIEDLRAQLSGGAWHIFFVARDHASDISAAAYSLDAGPWRDVFPVGQLTDSLVENYDIALRHLPPGEHTIAVRAADQFHNSTAAKVTFTVPASRP